MIHATPHLSVISALGKSTGILKSWNPEVQKDFIKYFFVSIIFGNRFDRTIQIGFTYFISWVSSSYIT